MNLNLSGRKAGLLLLFVFLLGGSMISRAQTTMSAGDLVIVGFNATDNTVNTTTADDNFDFLLLRDIAAGTIINFTDLGWLGSTFIQNSNNGCSAGDGGVSDGCIQWTCPAGGLTAGTQVRVDCKVNLTASSGTVTGKLLREAPPASTYMDLATGTDQIFAFQSSNTGTPLSGTITLIAAVQWGSVSWTTPSSACVFGSSSQSADPGASVGGYGMLFTSTDHNAFYNYTTHGSSGTAASLRSSIITPGNWTANPTTAYALPLPVTFAVGIQWQGTTSNWFTTSNWSCTCTPSGTEDVIIATSTAYPNISTGTGTVKSITINSGASMTVSSSGVLQIAGTITNNGTFSASAGGITFNGSTTQTLNGNLFNGGTANTIEDLVISNTAGVSISNALNIAATGSLTVNSGSTLTTGGNLTLVSNSSGTARVAESAGTISGNVTLQRYIPGGRRAYRFLSHPVTTTRALSELTDDIDITGTGGSLNGFTTTTTNHPSAMWYDQSVATGSTSADPGWTAYTSTNGAGANGWQKGKGLLVLVRGSIGEGLNGAAYTPSAVTLDLVGNINQGSQIINISKGSGTTYYFTGNPFPCQIQMNAVTRGGGIGTSYYTWDPNFGTKGAYVNRAWTGSYSMPSWAGFITIVNSSSTLTFDEADKTSATPGAVFKTTADEDNIVFMLTSNNNNITWDRLQFMFNSNSVNDSDAYDGAKFVNPEVNFYSYSNNNVHLSIDSRPYKDGEIIPLNITSAPEGNYAIKAEEFNINAGMTASLHDKYLNKTVALSSGYVYNFDITADAATQNNRFELLLSGEPVTSVKTVAGSDIKVEVAPNPAHDVVNLSYSLPVSGKAEVRIINVQGAVCRTIKPELQTTGNLQVDVKNLPAGMYIVELTCGGEKTTQKFIKD